MVLELSFDWRIGLVVQGEARVLPRMQTMVDPEPIAAIRMGDVVSEFPEWRIDWTNILINRWTSWVLLQVIPEAVLR